MSFEPAQRFLSVSSASDPAELLGLTGGETSRTIAAIDEALRRRLAQTYNHPDGRSEEADALRRRLRDAAATLRSRVAPTVQHVNVSRVRGNAPPLTEFDRNVLAVLVGSGGWNAVSRARLIAMAATHGVTSDGLLKIITGLCRYAGPGHDGGTVGAAVQRALLTPQPTQPVMTGGLPSVKTAVVTATPNSPIAHSPGRAATNGPPLRPQTVPQPQSSEPSVDEEETEEGRARRRTWAFSLAFGLLTLVIGAMAIYALAPRTLVENPLADLRTTPAPDPAESQRGAREPGEAVDPSELSNSQPAQRRPARPLHNWGIAKFDSLPTFQWPIPERARDAKLIADTAPDELDALARRIEVSGNLALNASRMWSDIIENVSASWVLLDERTARAIEHRLIDVFVAAAGATASTGDGSDPDSAGSRLLSELAAPARLSDPLDLWRGTWKVAMLASITTHPDPPEQVKGAAREMLAQALNSPTREFTNDRRLSAMSAASSWLRFVVPKMIEAVDDVPRGYELWEMWIEAQKHIGPSERANAALVQAVREILKQYSSRHRLASVGYVENGMPSPSSAPREPSADLRIIGRLLQEADFSGSAQTREQFLALLDDEEIALPDLWLITSLLASSSESDVRWFEENERYVVDPVQAGVLDRVRQEIDRAWPESAARIVQRNRPDIDPVIGAHWHRVAERMAEDAMEVGSEEAMLRQIVRSARMGEAAALLVANVPVRAERSIEVVEKNEAPRTADTGESVGVPARSEGSWAVQYDEARRDVEERMRLLAALRAQVAGDLHTDDAAVFVREVYRGTPAELRELAQEILLTAFPRGPNVAREMLDQFPSHGNVPRAAGLSQTLGRYIGQTLPMEQGRAEEWTAQVRLGLVEHLLALLHDKSPIIQSISDELGDAYRQQAGALHRQQFDPAAQAGWSPSFGAASIFEYWLTRAQAHAASRLGEEIEAIERRHAARLRLADGPIQTTIAYRIGALEFMAVAIRAEEPGLDRRISRLLEDAAAKRQTAQSALLQALLVERATLELWRIRLDVFNDVGAEDELSTLRPSNTAHRAYMLPIWRAAAITAPLYVSTPAERASERWNDRLEALTPYEPLAYFELAEEIADIGDSRDVPLAKRLFGLAGALAPDTLGRSACLAIADLEEDPRAKQRLLALATMLGDIGDPFVSGNAGNDGPQSAEDSRQHKLAALAISEAFSHYRQGQGQRAATMLRRDDLMQLLRTVESALPWASADAFLSECASRSTQLSIADRRLVGLLQVERFLLSGAERDWAMELAFEHGRPLIEVDPSRLDKALNVDASRPYYREGQWRIRP